MEKAAVKAGYQERYLTSLGNMRDLVGRNKEGFEKIFSDAGITSSDYRDDKILERLEKGMGREGDIDLLTDVAGVMAGRTFCPLGDGAAGVVTGMIKHFRNEFEEHIKNKKCSLAES